jgi:hydroxymethylglutaryl-CoA lyase
MYDRALQSFRSMFFLASSARWLGRVTSVASRLSWISMTLPHRIRITEVGPRDGLQNEKQAIAAAVKVDLIERLHQAGCRWIEVTGFVSPAWVPQLADAADVMQGICRHPDTTYAVLVPNMKGLQAALAVRPDEIVVFGAASESFSRRNINCSIDESIERFAPVCAEAQRHRLPVRGSISCAFGCPYEGDVAPQAVRRVAQAMKDIGVHCVSVADTIGVGTPRTIRAVMEHVLQVYEPAQTSGHFHDTYGMAIANIHTCLELGIAHFDSSVAGLGGCPYAAGATGNVATEDLVYLMRGLGIETGIDLDRIVDVGQWISGVLGRRTSSRAGNAWAARRAAGRPS